MSERRRMLLAIVNQFKWLPYSYTYLYHSLVPQTISGKNVRNKAKLGKIYGESEVRNQLVKNGNFEDVSGWYCTNTGTLSASNNILTLLASSNIAYSLYRANADYPTIIPNHKYLHIVNIKPSVNCNSRFECGNSQQTFQSLTANQWTTLSYVATPSNTSGFFSVVLVSGLNANDTIQYQNYIVIDLTQAYPFDTPTTLTDNRVKNILAQGYIPYNTGEIKDMVIGEFNSEDSNNQPLGTLQLPAPYQSSGIGTSKDTWEITNTSHIFTRNNFEVELGGLTWTYESLGSGDNYYSDIISNAVKYSVVLCDKYTCDMSVSPATLRNNVWINQSGRINITADGYSGNVNNFKTAMSGVMLKYQLATPQTITIPRKHLAVVDLGSLDYVAQGNGRFVSSGLTQTIKPVSDNANIGNIYCSEYLSVSYYNISTNMSICVHTSGNIYIQDSSKSNMSATDFKNAMQGQYLFYETDTEVADITDTFDIEAGGTITSDSEVLPDVDFSMKCK